MVDPDADKGNALIENAFNNTKQKALRSEEKQRSRKN